MDFLQSALSHATSHSDSSASTGGGGNSELFTQALSFLNDRRSHYEDDSADHSDLDEEHLVQSHRRTYGQQQYEDSADASYQRHDSSSLGSGAAMEAVKMYLSNSGSGSESGSGGDEGKNKLIGMAMAQASRLWEEKNGRGEAVEGDKQSAVNKAAEMALKMYMKGQRDSSGGGAGPSGLMGLMGKFM